MKIHRLFFCAALLLTACHAPPPEGVYPCTMASDCPAMWVCRADLHCWSHEVPVDGGSDASSDAPPIDAFACVAEQCNGRDDDCDGLVDEGVLTVGTASAANPTPDPSPGYSGALIAPLTNGFAVLGTSRDTTGGGWSTVDFGGTTRSTAPSSTQTVFFDAASRGDLVVASGVGSTAFGLFTFDFATSTMPRSFLPIGNTTDDLRVAFVASTDGTYAHLYTLGTDAAGATVLRRMLVDTTGPSIVPDTDVLLSSDLVTGFALLHTSVNDYLVHRASTNELVFWRDEYRPTGLTGLGFINVEPHLLTGSQLAIRDPQRPVSPTNPILFVWATTTGVVSFVEITNTVDSTSFAMSPIRSLSGTRGPTAGLFPLHPIAIAPAPFNASSDPPHWLVAIVGNDGGAPTLSIVQVFEITETTVREIPVPDEMYVERDQVGLATSQGHIRLAESGNVNGIVTRSIGCE